MYHYILISNTKKHKINDDLVKLISKQIETLIGLKIVPKELCRNQAVEWKVNSVQINPDLITKLENILEKMNIDLNIINPQKVRRKKLLLADMDSTIIEEESLDEIAKLIGLEKEISKITSDAMKGKIDFEQSLVQRVKMLKDQPIEILDEIKNNIKLNLGAKELVKTMTFHGAKTILVSGGFTFLTNYLKDKLGFHYAHANILQISEDSKSQKLTGRVEYPILDKDAKLDYLKKYTEKYNLNMDSSICVGDGANDIEMIKNAGLGVSYNGKNILNKAADITFNNTNLKGLLYAQGITEREIIKE